MRSPRINVQLFGCIHRGRRIPRMQILESPVLHAYDSHCSITARTSPQPVIRPGGVSLGQLPLLRCQPVPQHCLKNPTPRSFEPASRDRCSPQVPSASSAELQPLTAALIAPLSKDNVGSLSDFGNFMRADRVFSGFESAGITLLARHCGPNAPRERPRRGDPAS